MFKPLGMIASCLALSCAATFASALETTGPDRQEVLPLALRGVHFVPNQGQWSDAEVYFGLRSCGLDVAFRESALTMHLVRQAGPASRGGEEALAPNLDALLPDDRDSLGDRAEYEHLTLTVSFPGSYRVVPEGGKPRKAHFNYFVGGEGRAMASDVPSFGAVVYHNLYDGIDLHVMGSDDGVLKYEFHAQPGADYGRIRIAYDGIESLCIDDAGDLHIATAFGTLADRAPVVWQEIDGARSEVAARFDVCDPWTYRILIQGEVDAIHAIVIDPDVEWMYYLGGTRDEWGFGVGIDSDGNVLVGGQTWSFDFEGAGNFHHGGTVDVYVAKADRDGALLWMTYLGGSGDDRGGMLAIDSANNTVMVGSTKSDDFEGRNNSYRGTMFVGDAYALKVDTTGQLAWMTYLGGSGNELAYEVVVDRTDSILTAGYTFSEDFEGATNANHGQVDGFMVRIQPDGSLTSMTYYGGRLDDYALAIALDEADRVWIAGETASNDWQGSVNSYHGARDGFLLRTGQMGSVDWMVYLGGSDWDTGRGLAVHASDYAVVTGQTRSTDLDARTNEYHGAWDGYAAKVSDAGAIEWSTYTGGSGDDFPEDVVLRSDGTAFLDGGTTSMVIEGQINSNHGMRDAYIIQLSPRGEVDWMTFVGGSDDDIPKAIALDSVGDIYLSGLTDSTDFEFATNEPHRERDAFILKLRLVLPLQLVVESTCPSGGPIQVSWSNATPGGQVALLFARIAGSFAIPNGRPCAGTVLGLGPNQLQIAFQGSAGPEGSRTLNSNAGAGACGGHLQLLDLATCRTSIVARVE